MPEEFKIEQSPDFSPREELDSKEDISTIVATRFRIENQKFNGEEFKGSVNIEEVLSRISGEENYTEQDAVKNILTDTMDMVERINAILAIEQMTKYLGYGLYGKTSPEKGESYQYPSRVLNCHIDAYNTGYGEMNVWYPGMSPSETEEEVVGETQVDIERDAPFQAPEGYHWESDFLQGQYWALVSDNMSDQERNHILDILYGTESYDEGTRPRSW